MAKYTIHSVDGGYVPAMEEIDYYGGAVPYPGLGLTNGSYGYNDTGSNSGCDYICMCTRMESEMGYDESQSAYMGKILAIRVTPNIVFEDEDGNRVRLK